MREMRWWSGEVGATDYQILNARFLSRVEMTKGTTRFPITTVEKMDKKRMLPFMSISLALLIDIFAVTDSDNIYTALLFSTLYTTL